MSFLQNIFQNDPALTFSKIFVFLFFFLVVSVAASFFYDYKKNLMNLNRIKSCEIALKDLIEAFRSIENLCNEQKKILDEYKYILERHNHEISRLGDSLNKDSNITLAIKMANEGKSVDEISSATGMSPDEIEPIMKYHGK